MFRKSKFILAMVVSAMTIGLLTAQSASAAQLSTVANGTFSSGAVYSAAQVNTGNVVAAGINGKYYIFDSTGTQVIYTGTWYHGSTVLINNVAALTDGNVVLAGNGGHYEIIDPTGNMIKQGIWPIGSSVNIHAACSLNNGTFLLGGDSGNFAILDNTGATVKYGKWPPYSNNTALGIRSALQLYNNNIMVVSSGSTYDIWDSAGNEVRSGAFTNVTSAWDLAHFTASNGKEQVVVSGASYKYDYIDANGIGLAGGSVTFSNAQTTSVLPSGTIFIGGSNGSYSLLDQAGNIQGTYAWYSNGGSHYNILDSIVLHNGSLFLVGAGRWEVMREY